MEEQKKTPKKRIHLILFILTLLTTTLAGSEWMFARSFFFSTHPLGWNEFLAGFQFSIPFLAILTAHEFGHYFIAIKNKVKVSLPYYMPFWFGFIGMPSIGTVGAFIRIREKVNNQQQSFDIGVAGPVAGFVLAVLVLVYGFANLPPKTYVYKVHPEYEVLGEDFDKFIYTTDTFVLKTDVEKFNPEYAEAMPDTVFFYKDMPSIAMGNTLLFTLLENTIVPDSKRDRIPDKYEAFHYPLLFAGFLALFFTALNLLPIGQLDGGHVIYGMFGSKSHAIISRTFFVGLVFYSGLGLISPYDTSADGEGFLSGPFLYIPIYIGFLYYILRGFGKDPRTRLTWAVGIFAIQYLTVQFFPGVQGYHGWLVFAFLIGRFLGVDYPPARIQTPLDTPRIILGWFALIILILSFSPAPLVVEGV